MEIVKARADLRFAMLEASKLRNGLELKRALEQAISYGVNPTSELCKSVKQLMYVLLLFVVAVAIGIGHAEPGAMLVLGVTTYTHFID